MTMSREPKDVTVLVVEDEKALRDTIVFDLKRKGFNMLSADGADSALKLIKSHKIHLVLSDIRMPGGDGLFLLDQIRAIDQDIPVVILMTGYTDFDKDHCLSKGAKMVISKPFDRGILLESIKKFLDIGSPGRR